MKKGFTLAEVLVTLAIIGVVAAITIPVLNNSALEHSAIAGLSKAKNSFENANATMLAAEQSDSITDLIGSGEVEVTKNGKLKIEDKFNEFYIEKLMEYLNLEESMQKYKNKISKYNGEEANIQDALGGCTAIAKITGGDGKIGYVSSDGMSYNFDMVNHSLNSNATKPKEQMIGSFVVDVNGAKNPNTLGKDIFGFVVYNDGHVKPHGGENFSPRESDMKEYWDGEYSCNKDGVKSNGLNCTGSIFDNGMKIIYK